MLKEAIYATLLSYIRCNNIGQSCPGFQASELVAGTKCQVLLTRRTFTVYDTRDIKINQSL